jgi:hypothetical protein
MMHSLRCTRYLSTFLSSKATSRIAATNKWLDDIVIGEKLCPFAPPVSKQPQLRICVSNATNHDEIIREIETEAHRLVGDLSFKSDIKMDTNSDYERPETTLVVLDEEKCPSLSDFRDLVHLSWRVQAESIVENGYENDLQIVLFHPLAVHDTYSAPQEGEEDAADYTIRSPFPILHLLREEDVMRAVSGGYADLEGLPSRNKKKFRKQGWKVCKHKLEACMIGTSR